MVPNIQSRSKSGAMETFSLGTILQEGVQLLEGVWREVAVVSCQYMLAKLLAQLKCL